MTTTTTIFTMTSTDEPSSVMTDGEIGYIEVKLDAETDNSQPVKEAKKSKMLFSCRKYCFCIDSMSRYKNPLPDNATICQKIRFAFLCPPHGIIGSYITTFFIFAILYAVFLSLVGGYALPRSNLFGLWVLFICCITGGYLVQFVKLPPLLGKYFLDQHSICVISWWLKNFVIFQAIMLSQKLFSDPPWWFLLTCKSILHH